MPESPAALEAWAPEGRDDDLARAVDSGALACRFRDRALVADCFVVGGLGTEAARLDAREGHRGIGTRTAGPAPVGRVEVRLEVDASLAGADGFIEAVVRQHEAFSGFDHPQVAPTRALERRVAGRRPCLDVVATHDEGEPLGHLLGRLSAAGVSLSTAAALFVARELLGVVRAVQVHRPGGFHGALTLDAVVITRDQRLIVRDHVFGRALGTVTLPPSTWWEQFGIAVPRTPGIPSFTPLTDQLQLGVIVLSAFLGRPLDHHDDLQAVGGLLETVIETSIDGDEQPLGIALKSWLARTLLVASEGPFRSLNAASDSLDELLDAEAGYVAAPIGLDVEVARVDAVASVVPMVIETVVPPVEVTVAPDAHPTDVPIAAPRLVSHPAGPVAPLAPAAPAARPDPFAGHRFIIESNDGRSSSLIGEEKGYEPFTAPAPSAPPAEAPALSVYGTESDALSVETNPVRGTTPTVPHDAVRRVPRVPSTPVTLPPEPSATPGPVAPPVAVAVATPRAPGPESEAPKPFWEIPAPGARDAHAPGAVLSFSRPAERVAAPAADPVAPTPPGDRPPVPPDPLDVVVNAPPPTFGVVTPVVTTQVSTKTSSLLRAAVEEFEQPVAKSPAPPVPPPQATMHAVSPVPHPEPVPVPVPVPPSSRQTGVHGVSRGTVPAHAPARRSSLGLDDFEAPAAPTRRSRWVVLAAVLAVVTGGGLAAAYLYVWPREGAAVASGDPGRLRLESKPAGALVRVNGVEKGQTPLTLPVPPGAYRIEFERGDQARSLSTAVTSNNETYQVVTLYPPGPPGELHIVSLPKGAGVTVNGEPRGKTPLQLDGLPPGEYTVVVENGVARAEQKVEVLPEQVAAVDIPLSGTLAVSSPFPVHISDRDRPLGQLRTGSLSVGAGLRRLRLANDELGFEETREVEVAAGGVTRLVVTPPSGVLNITADTETDVYLDGRPIGLTPLTNLSVALGVHEVTFRHARWGEQNYTVLVGLTTPSRLHVTMAVKAPKVQQRRAPTPVRRRP